MNKKVRDFLKRWLDNGLIDDETYNKILSLSRNKIFYTNFGLSDTFQNRINLIFLQSDYLIWLNEGIENQKIL